MNGLKFVVDSKKCVRCGACIRDCAPGILAPGEGGIPVLLPETESRCTRCQHCLAVCPVGAMLPVVFVTVVSCVAVLRKCTYPVRRPATTAQAMRLAAAIVANLLRG